MRAHKNKTKSPSSGHFHVDEDELQALGERISQWKINESDCDALSH
jgi:hypothetical protein